MTKSGRSRILLVLVFFGAMALRVMSSCKLEEDYTKDDDTVDGHDVPMGMSSPASRKRVQPDGGATPETPRKSTPRAPTLC